MRDDIELLQLSCLAKFSGHRPRRRAPTPRYKPQPGTSFVPTIICCALLGAMLAPLF